MTPAQLVLLNALKNKKRLKRAPVQPHPDPQIREYRKRLQPYLNAVAFAIAKHLLINLPALQKKLYGDRPENARQDAPINRDLDIIMGQIKSDIDDEFPIEIIQRIARGSATSVSSFNKRAVDKGISQVAGLDVFAAEPWLAQELELYVIGNTTLIKGLQDQALAKVQQIVYDGFRAGTRWEDISTEIQESADPDDGLLASRADFIARDQVSSLNGQLTQLRQTNLGVKSYIWRTSLDDRVRDSHRSKEGKIFDWSSPPADTGHPGEDYNCRCTAEPYLEGLLGEEFESSAPNFEQD